MLTVLLQDVPPTGLMDKLADQGPLVALLLIAVWWLTKRDTKRDEKLDKYIQEDREKMITTIQNNTLAMNEMTRVMEEKREIDNELLSILKGSAFSK